MGMCMCDGGIEWEKSVTNEMQVVLQLIRGWIEYSKSCLHIVAMFKITGRRHVSGVVVIGLMEWLVATVKIIGVIHGDNRRIGKSRGIRKNGGCVAGISEKGWINATIDQCHLRIGIVMRNAGNVHGDVMVGGVGVGGSSCHIRT